MLTEIISRLFQIDVVMLILLFPILLLMMMAYMKLTRPKDEEAKPDTLLMAKTGMYILQMVMFQFLLFGIFYFIDIILSQITSHSIKFSNIKNAIGMIIGSAIVLGLLEFILIKMDTKNNYVARRTVYGFTLFIIGIVATLSTYIFISSLFEFFPKGASFHVPFAATLVYMPVFVMGCLYYKAEFSEEKEVQTFLPASIVNKADQVMAQVPGANAAGFGAMNAYGQQPMAGGYGVQPMAQQPMAQQPMAQQPMVQQPMAQQYSQPVAQQPAAAPVAAAPSNACPSCGQAPRFIAQYNRNWCDTCQKYL